MKDSGLIFIGLGAVALFAASQNAPSTTQTPTQASNVVALTSTVAQQAITNIASVYGTTFANQLSNALITQDNAAGVFNALGYNIPVPSAAASKPTVTLTASQAASIRKTIQQDQAQVNSLTAKQKTKGFSYGTLDAINSYLGAIGDLQGQLAAAGLN